MPQHNEIATSIINKIRGYQESEFFTPRPNVDYSGQTFDSAAGTHHIEINGEQVTIPGTQAGADRLHAEIIIRPSRELSDTDFADLTQTSLENLVEQYPELMGIVIKITANLPAHAWNGGLEEVHVSTFEENGAQNLFSHHPKLGDFIVAVLNGGLHKIVKS